MTVEAGTPFYRLSAAGNDFLALVEPTAPPTGDQIRLWCRRGVSLGCDGLFVLTRDSGDLVDMEHYNADGRVTDLCMNGTRCAARLAFELGWARRRARIRTARHTLTAEAIDGSSIRLEAPLPEEPPRELSLTLGGETLRGWRLVVGVPHFVIRAKGALDEVPVAAAGREIRSHEALGKAGANVNFVRFSTPHQIEIRTFERGVEGETLACGSGILATVAVGMETGRSQLPTAVGTRSGFVLHVEGCAERSRPSRWSLSGDARLVSRGELYEEAASVLPG